jgi:hypothetical protein
MACLGYPGCRIEPCGFCGGNQAADASEIPTMTDFTETRSMLKKMAMQHGADTTIGHAAHNLLEMTENYAKTSDPEQRRQLKSSINRQMARLLKQIT